MKIKVLLSVLVLSLTLSVGCARQNNTNQTPNTTQNQNQNQGSKPDGVTTASIVDNAAAFQKAIGTNGTWIIAIVKDISTDKDLVLEGEYKNGKKDKDGKDIIQRKIALYTQDEKRNVTARFTLTAPKLTINSPNASIQHGTFKGDLYVSTKDFQLVDAKVDGNIYFTNAEAKAGFKMDDKSSVTGKQEVKK
ncbi:hypothetical protein [Clostridium sp. HMP27]|uniref:hypothetical protein n=1 Tax=Clostridium sp. HMP27 TaxID=1487921 RepID=UPI00052E2767|nr:hypothetical protein [Clostridium sp. HMP27]KGK89532.1 hypothetical protein DP68_03445 [Clostridium sp. HMP27]